MSNIDLGDKEKELAILNTEYKALLEGELQHVNEFVEASAPRISIKGKQFRIDDTVLGEKLLCVILRALRINRFYEGKFDVKNPVPSCFSFGGEIPEQHCKNKQSESCADCYQNQWGSLPEGGKACSNNVRLCIASVSDLNQLSLIEVPPSSLRNYNAYIRKLAGYNKCGNIVLPAAPPYAVVTEISFDETVDFPKLKFACLSLLKKELFQKAKEMRESALVKKAMMTYSESKNDQEISG